MQIIDTHAHYDDKAFDGDRDEILSSLPSHGVICCINVGASIEGAKESIRLAEKYDHVYAACGIHPDDTGYFEDRKDMSDPLEEIRALASHPKCVAIGEIGLDYHWMVQSKEVQQYWFAIQLELALEADRPINIHSRDAAQDTFDMVKQYHGHDGRGIIHCFSGSAQMAREYVKMGYHLGIGGVVTYKNGRVLKEVVSTIPIEYLVTETDCPYLAPAGHRGERNYSGYLPIVVEEIARLKGMETEEAAAILYENARRVYRLP